jgi:excisionase family DNA binding protein
MMQTKVEDRYVSTLHAARLLSCSRHTILRMLAKGELKGEQIANRMVVLKASLPSAAPEQEKP